MSELTYRVVELADDPIVSERYYSNQWYDPNGVGLSVVGAYRAINSAENYWRGAPNVYADTLIDRSGNGNHLTEGNGEVSWDKDTGWSFETANAQYFDTGIILANNNVSMFVQYSGFVIGASPAFLIGSLGVAPPLGGVAIQWTAGGPVAMRCYNGLLGNECDNQPGLETGNYAFSGLNAYRNGSLEAVQMTSSMFVVGIPVYIAATNFDGVGPLAFSEASIEAVVIYDDDVALVQSQVTDIVEAMGEL